MAGIKLIEALRYSDNPISAFIGAGGKTTAMFLAAKELFTLGQQEGHKNIVLVTTTTHLGIWQSGLADYHIRLTGDQNILDVIEKIDSGIVLLTGEESKNRLSGLDADILEKVYLYAEEMKFPLLIEADGAANRPLKAPGSHEPVIPVFANNVVVVAGMAGLGKPLTEDWVHRPELFGSLAGIHLGDEITLEAIEKVLLNENGGLKNIPSAAHKVVLLNQADHAELQSKGKTTAERLLGWYHTIIVAALKKGGEQGSQNEKEIDQQRKIYAVVEQIAGIVLAAGGSSRFGKPKQNLQWKGQSLIRHVVLSAIKAGLSPLVVVVGSSSDVVIRSISDLPVRIVNNADWMSGLSSSIKKGVSVLPNNIGGAIFLHADQPAVSQTLIRKIIETHQETFLPIVAPQIDGRRGNPVLFDINTFSDLLTLEGDIGGRALFSHYPVHWVTWHDAKEMTDIDTPEDYDKFVNQF